VAVGAIAAVSEERGKVMTKRSKVGARSHQAVSADPQATEVEIRAMSRKNPIGALQHPNCPAALWWLLAGHHPAEAQACVLFELMTLENPEKWTAILETLENQKVLAATRQIKDQIAEQFKKLSKEDCRRFLADCAERVLPLFEAVYPTKTPRHAIEIARAYANGEASAAELRVARIVAEKVTDDAFANIMRVKHSAGACYAAMAASQVAAANPRPASVNPAANAMAQHTKAGDNRRSFDEHRLDEHAWQLRHLQTYLPGKVGGGFRFSEEEIKKAMVDAGGHPGNAAKSLGANVSTFRWYMKQYGVHTVPGLRGRWRDVKSPAEIAAVNQKISEGNKDRWGDLTPTQREARNQRTAETTQDAMSAATPAERAAWTEAAHQARWVNMPPAERAEAERRRVESMHRQFDSLSPTERAAWSAAIQKGWENRSDEQKENFSERMKAKFQALSPEEKQKALAAITARRRKKKKT